jgi:aspartate/methionine/tyrosine aminotransferase
MDFADLNLGLAPHSMNRLYQAVSRLQENGKSILDLISGSAHAAGICFPEELLQEIFAQAIPRARRYRPDPLGQETAREAIARYYAGQGIDIPLRQILLTPGSSLSYLYCFRLLTDPGDEIICPIPSYPLFDLIARICNVELISYRLREEWNWGIDLDYLESRLTTRTKAMVLISPHNPTGMVASFGELAQLAEIALRHNLPIISDEVFSEFLFPGGVLPRLAATKAPLVFTLNGFSKMFALPGMKLGWIAVNGDPEKVSHALETLELMSDTFLPVNEMVQFCVPEVLSRGRLFLEDYRSRVEHCRDLALDLLSDLGEVQFVPPAGGFYLTLRSKDPEPRWEDETLVLRLLETRQVLLHPGFFYDLPPAHLVMTFVQAPLRLQEGLAAIREVLRETLEQADKFQ